MTVKRTRDRRGRGRRGPSVSSPDGRLIQRGEPRVRFDQLVLREVMELDARWQDSLGLVEYAVEETPQVSLYVPVVLRSELHRGGADTPARIVLYRRPIEAAAANRVEAARLIREEVATHLAQLLDVPTSTVVGNGLQGPRLNLRDQLNRRPWR